jgi:hypothetical protein
VNRPYRQRHKVAVGGNYGNTRDLKEVRSTLRQDLPEDRRGASTNSATVGSTTVCSATVCSTTAQLTTTCSATVYSTTTCSATVCSTTTQLTAVRFVLGRDTMAPNS